MGKVIAIEHLTLDGVIQAPARPDEDTRNDFSHGGWAAQRQNSTMRDAMAARMSDEWALLAGRITYEDLYDYWPKQPSNPNTDAFERVTKYVVSTTMSEPLPWDGSVLLRSTEDVARVRKEQDGNLVVFGSGALVRSLLDAGLVDEMLLMVHPLVVGRGERLFSDEGDRLASFVLVESTVTTNGVFVGTYVAQNG